MVNMYTKNKEMIYTLRRVLLMLCVFVTTTLSAQNISVASFKMLPNDLTANTHGTMEKDFNGEVAALIKVVTTEQGFVFDGGMVGIVKTMQRVGEVWVYVPRGIKKITILHQQLGVLRDYNIPIPIEKARTYEMVLTTGKVETMVTQAVTNQYVVFNVTPTDAVVELEGEPLSVDEEGRAKKKLPFGTYSYRVSHANYYTSAGKVAVTAQERAEVNVSLRPKFGWIRLTGANEYHGASIYIDNVRMGQLPLTSKGMESGTHQVRVVKSMYKPYEGEVMVVEGETTELDVQLIPNFATVTLVAKDDCEIWVDGEKVGEGQWIGPLEMGEYEVEIKKESHRAMREIVKVESLNARTIRLKSPTPIYASLDISSTPSATAYIDGTRVGETPLIKSEVLIGTHRVTLEKSGYKTVEKTVVVKENIENIVDERLYKEQSAVVAQQQQPSKQPVSDITKKGENWLVGVDAGYSVYGLNYGGEIGLNINGLLFTAGVKSHIMGSYEYRHSMKMDVHDGTVSLLRFSAKVGYTLGNNWQATPQVGVVFGPSHFMGRDYVTGEIKPYEDYYNHGYIGYVLLHGTYQYQELNNKIIQFAQTRCAVSVGARLGYTADFGLGIYVTPEYIIGEGGVINAGISMSF